MMSFLKSTAIEKSKQREARVRLTIELLELLEKARKENVRWKGSVTDLMEVVHIAYQTGRVCNPDGSLCQFGDMVSRTCLLLNIRMPVHPRQTAFSAEQRKGVKRDTFFVRYYRMMMANEEKADCRLSILRMYTEDNSSGC